MEEDRYIGLASNYKLSGKSCDKKQDVIRQKKLYLKNKFNNSRNWKERHKVSKEVNLDEQILKGRKKERGYRYIISPLVN